MESQTNMQSQTNMESQTNTLSSSILTNVVSIQVPDVLDKKDFENCVIKLMEDMITEKIKSEDEKLFKDKTVRNILHELDNNVTAKYIENIMNFNHEYKNNDVIRLIIQYHAHYYDIKIEDELLILGQFNSRILLGLLLHIPVDILIKMSKERPSEWICDELEYYKISKNISIDEICKNIHSGIHNDVILDYLKINHADLLLKYNKITCTPLAIKMTEMKDLLKI